MVLPNHKLGRYMNTFNVGATFPANPANVTLMQLWIATRQVLVLQRALLAKPGPAEVEHEQFLHTFLVIAATLNEASDAFVRGENLGCFNSIPADIQPELALAKKECDVSNAASLKKRILVRLRNKVGSHFDRTLIQKGLSKLSRRSLPLRIGGTSFFESTFPLATSLVDSVLEDIGITPQDALHVFPSVINLGSALQKLADAAVTIAVQRQGPPSAVTQAAAGMP